MSNPIPQSFLDEVLARTDIVEIIETRVQLRKTGSNYAALCPFHHEKTPSFTVSPTKQFYYCFGCSAHGNAISFLMQFDRLEFMDAVELLANKVGLPIPQQTSNEKAVSYQHYFSLLEQVNKFYQTQLKKSEKAITYLKSRGISGQIAKHFNLGYAPEGWENLPQHFVNDIKIIKDLIATGMLIKKDNQQCYDRFRARITFPIRDIRGRVIAFGGRTLGNDLPKYLNSPETAIFHKGSELYGLYEARQANHNLAKIIIVEGYMDVIALAQHDILYAVATLGTATSQKHLQRLFRYSNHIIFCFDGDNAGKQAAWRALEITLPLMHDGLQISFMFLPDNEDPDSYVRKYGKVIFEEQITKALPLSEFFFQHLMEQLNIQTPDGKAKLAALAKQLLNKIPQGIFQGLMLDQLAKRIGIDAQKLSSSLNMTLENSTDSYVTKPIPKTNILRSPIKMAIILLLKQPSLAKEINNLDFLKTFKNAGAEILLKLLEILKQQPQLTTGMLLEHWRDQKIAAYLAKLAAYEHPVPSEGLKEEFLGALKRIADMSREQDIQQLLTKARAQTLTQAEKEQLQKLLASAAKNSA